ncbi:hypothetical protein D3C74_248820 [compost metagenome]
MQEVRRNGDPLRLGGGGMSDEGLGEEQAQTQYHRTAQRKQTWPGHSAGTEKEQSPQEPSSKQQKLNFPDLPEGRIRQCLTPKNGVERFPPSSPGIASRLLWQTKQDTGGGSDKAS